MVLKTWQATSELLKEILEIPQCGLFRGFIFGQKICFMFENKSQQEHKAQAWLEFLSVAQIVTNNRNTKLNKDQKQVCSSRMFFKIVVLQNLANFTGKNLCWSPVKFAKFLRTPFL